MATTFFKKDGKVCYKTEKAVKDEAEKAKTKKEKK